MRVTRLHLRDFRNYEAAELELPAGLTVVIGPNGAGKTNLLEAIYFGCTARSPRTSNEREVVRRGGSVARVVVDTRDEEGAHRIEVGFEPGEQKRLRVDGSPVDNLSTVVVRPLVSVFLPERLELVKGAPATRRAHLDQVISALWPGRAETRAAYSRALAQRNALLGRIRAGASGPAALDAWDGELARHGIRLMADRRRLGNATLVRLPADVRGEARDTVLARRHLAAIPRSPGRLPRVRVAAAGVKIIESRLTRLAYSPEIAHAMLRRQQANAIVAARARIVEGAVGMVEMALVRLAENHVVDLDEERKAAMVSNLLVVLCGDRDAQPVVNAGTLYS